MARPVEHADDDVAGRHALGGSHGLHIFGWAFGQIDNAVGIAGANGDLVHVHVRRVEQPAFFGNRQHGQRVGAGLGGDGGAFQWIQRDIDARAGADGLAHLFADEQHRRFVALAFTDHHGAIEIQHVERAAHGFHGGSIGGLFVAAPDHLGCANGGIFGDAHHFENEHAIKRRRRLYWA